MRVDLAISGYAVTGPGSEHAAESNRLDLPPPGTKRKGGRLPLLAATLAERLCERPDTSACVHFGSAFGCLTETELFVEHLVEAGEATPRRTAFATASHGSIASRVALELDAGGESRTHSHGEVSFVHALFAACMTRRRTAAPIYTGALDEAGRCAGGFTAIGEGGGMLLCDGADAGRITALALGRPTDLGAFLAREIPDPGILVAVPGLDGTYPEVGTAARAPFDPLHPSLAATATCLAVGILGGEVSPRALGLDVATDAITLVVGSRFGDCAAVQIEA